MRESHFEDLTQAERVIRKFGSSYRLAKLLGKAPSSVRRWTYPRHKGGTEGRIPTSVWAELFRVARLEGVMLDESDMDPRVRRVPR